MLTQEDEYPFHQTPEPMAYAGTDRNFYDRFWFGGYSKDHSLYFSLAFGLYAQLDIMDAAFSVSWQGKQYNLRASRLMHAERAVLTVGPISLEIISPLESSRIRVSDKESGISAELVFTARHAPIQEPRFMRRNGTRVFMDYTRMTQNVTWQGYIDIQGERIELLSDMCRGTRDRSWGIRPVGTPDSQPARGSDDFGKQFFWLWTPTNFDSHVLFSHTNDDRFGCPWNRRGVIQAVSGAPLDFEEITYEYTWRPNSRRIDTLTCHMSGDEGEATLRYKTGNHFYMSGLGYFHPEWGHGRDHGELEVAFDVIALDSVDESDPLYWHIQAVSEAELEFHGATYKGTGLVEQMFLGAHEPTGMSEHYGPAKAAGTIKSSATGGDQ